jgi:hypothetical protein
MAVTKIIPIHTTIEKSVEYICNPDKTDGRLFVYSEHCVPQTAALTFHHYLSQARAGGNTIGRHLIQSFAPGEVSSETAHEIGKKMAAEILGGEYAFVLATHIDRGHIHNHFVWGAANIVTHKRYRSNKSTYHEIRNISDRLCKENSLSVIVPHGVGKSYTEYNADKNGTSWKSQLKTAIDNVLSESAGFEDFIRRMETLGYEVKRRNPISFRAPGQERFTRSKLLGEDYTEAIKRRISERSKPIEEEISPPVSSPQTEKPKVIKPLIDIAGNPKYAENRGLEQWARLQNLKNTVDAYNLMMEYGGLAAFGKLMIDCKTDIATIKNGIEANNAQLKRLKYLRDDMVTYYRTKPVYKQYKETKFFKEQFRKNMSARSSNTKTRLCIYRPIMRSRFRK